MYLEDTNRNLLKINIENKINPIIMLIHIPSAPKGFVNP